jgi:hypothetical protein
MGVMTEGMRRQSQDGAVGGVAGFGGEYGPPPGVGFVGFVGLDGLDGFDGFVGLLLLMKGGGGGKSAGKPGPIGKLTGNGPLSLHIALSTCTVCNLLLLNIT